MKKQFDKLPNNTELEKFFQFVSNLKPYQAEYSHLLNRLKHERETIWFITWEA